MDKENKSEIRKIYVGVICLIFSYALYAPTKIKQIMSMNVDGFLTNNLIWIIGLGSLILFISYKRNTSVKINAFILFLVLFLSVNILNLYKVNNYNQYIYSMLILFVPIVLFFFVRQCNKTELEYLLKFFIVNTLIYSILAILFSTHFAFFMKLAGNEYAQYQNYSQYRAPMMLGTSITVSYYLNLSLPLCFFSILISDKKWKRISIITIIMNILATTILLSRLATFNMLVIILLYILFNEKYVSFVYKMLIVLIMGCVLYFMSDSLDFSRLNIFNGVTDKSSNSLRYLSATLALYIWSQNMFIGTGMGQLFKRVYTENMIVFDGHIGLVDPHNMYVLILSEQGIIGFFFFILMILTIVNLFFLQKSKEAKKTSLIFLFAFSLAAMGGSHLYLSVSFGTLFWSYIGFYSRLDSIKKLEGKKYE